MKRKLTKKYSRHSSTIDLLTVLTLYVCATFMICIISLFLHCPHFGRRVHCTFTHHIGKMILVMMHQYYEYGEQFMKVCIYVSLDMFVYSRMF